ncbi:unnamed protein product, partial [marine sediment metagenome]
TEIKYDMKSVEKKRPKAKHIRSIFDPMIDAFIESGHTLVEIAIEDKKPGYMVTQLKNRIKRRELEIDIEVSHGGGFVYLEKKE